MSIELPERRSSIVVDKHGTHDHATLGEVLQTAGRFERTAREFYKALTRRVSKPVRALVDELTSEETRHFQLITELAALPETKEQAQLRVRRPPGDQRFSDLVRIPMVCDFIGESAILRYAMGREQAALDQYRFLAAQPLPPAVRDTFAQLATEEQHHKAELSKRYYEMAYTPAGPDKPSFRSFASPAPFDYGARL